MTETADKTTAAPGAKSEAEACDCAACRLAAELAPLLQAHLNRPADSGMSRVLDCLDALASLMADIIAQAPRGKARNALVVHVGNAVGAGVAAKSDAPRATSRAVH